MTPGDRRGRTRVQRGDGALVQGALLMLVGLYLIGGMGYIFSMQEWPPFWLPLDPSEQVRNWIHLSRTPTSVIGQVLLAALFLLVLGPVLSVLGLRVLLRWHHRVGSSPRA